MSPLVPSSLVAVAALVVASPAAAAEPLPPDHLIESVKAEDVKSDVAAEGFQQAKLEDAAAADALELKLSAGGLLTSGNSESLTVTGASDFRWRTGPHQLKLGLGGNFAESSASPSVDTEQSVGNAQWLTRYDYFFTHSLAGLVSVSGRHDPFQGLTHRLNVDPGLAWYFLNGEKKQLWIEAGYDLQWDVRTDEKIDEAAAADPTSARLDKGIVRHAARLFGGYEQSFNDYVSLKTGLELILPVATSEDLTASYDPNRPADQRRVCGTEQNLADPNPADCYDAAAVGDDAKRGDSAIDYMRVAWNIGLTSRFSDSFSLAVTFNLRYDNTPLPTVERLDTLTTLQLVYQAF